MNLHEIIDIAMEIESEDPIDWGLLSIDERESYKLIALSVLELWEDWQQFNDKDLIIVSTITKLMVENFVLNLKLQQRRTNE